MSKALKILLVEDDDQFRSTIKQTLTRKLHSVTEAPNGKVAKDMFLLDKYDVVLSDIQMPHFSGINLLEWIKQIAKVPVVLMTGFSQALETKKADEYGADGFLPKPFKENHLLEILEKYTRENPVVKSLEDLDTAYCRVHIDEFLSDKQTDFDVYIRISATKYIKIAHTGGKISDDRIQAYKEKDIHYVYIKKEDFPLLVKFNLQVAKVAKESDALSSEKKMNFMKSTSDLILENAFVNGINPETFSESRHFVETSLDVLTQDQQIFTVLEILSNHSDTIYSHCLGVSTFSVMIAKEMGWTSPTTLFKLALGGLLHDIGKKEIDRDLLEKPRPLLSHTERALIETHAVRGKEILESLPNIPSEVATIAYQHHEDMVGHGFPNRLTRNEIHPLARVVSVANTFCGYVIKHRSDEKPVSPQSAIHTMETLKAEALDQEAFAALKRLFKSKEGH